MKQQQLYLVNVICLHYVLRGQRSEILLLQPTDVSFVWTSNRMLETMCSDTPFLYDTGSAHSSGGMYGRQWMEMCCRYLEMNEFPSRCATVYLDVRQRLRISVQAECKTPLELYSSASVTADVASNMAAGKKRRILSGQSQALLHHSEPYTSLISTDSSTMWFSFTKASLISSWLKSFL